MPTTREEYEARFFRHAGTEGFGVEGVTQHFPCPFCAAADWYVVKLLEFGQDSPELTCEECGRSGRLLFVRDATGASMEMVQTGGDDPPEWLDPPPRRLGA